jgi:YHS domain-containing protein
LTTAWNFDNLLFRDVNLRTRLEGNIMAKDPVCNMTVDEKKAAGRSIYKGTTYHFCSRICKEKFDKDPEKFIPKAK